LDNLLLNNGGSGNGHGGGRGPLLHGGGGYCTNQGGGSGVWDSITDKPTDGTNITPTTDGTDITPTTDGTNITETNSSKACLRQNVCCSDNFGVLGANSEGNPENADSFHHV
jgi:hypothetical protein